MKAAVTYKAWAAFVAVTAVCQAGLGDFPADFFRFPVNAAVLLLWAVGLYVACTERRDWAVTRLLLAPHSTYALLAAFLAACLVQGFCSQRLTATWWFVGITAALLSHLLCATVRGARAGRPRRVRFLLVHAGVLLAVGGGFWGAPDTQTVRMALVPGQTERRAVSPEGRVAHMSRGLQLIRFRTETYPDGSPKRYEADIRTDDGAELTLAVNRPYALTWKDRLYLMATTPRYCVVEWVSQPWMYVQAAGILLLAAGCVLLFVQGAGRKRKEETQDDDMG